MNFIASPLLYAICADHMWEWSEEYWRPSVENWRRKIRESERTTGGKINTKNLDCFTFLLTYLALLLATISPHRPRASHRLLLCRYTQMGMWCCSTEDIIEKIGRRRRFSFVIKLKIYFSFSPILFLLLSRASLFDIDEFPSLFWWDIYRKASAALSGVELGSWEWSEREGSFSRALNIYFSSLFIMFSFLLIGIHSLFSSARPILPSTLCRPFSTSSLTIGPRQKVENKSVACGSSCDG